MKPDRKLIAAQRAWKLQLSKEARTKHASPETRLKPTKSGYVFRTRHLGEWASCTRCVSDQCEPTIPALLYSPPGIGARATVQSPGSSASGKGTPRSRHLAKSSSSRAYETQPRLRRVRAFDQLVVKAGTGSCMHRSLVTHEMEIESWVLSYTLRYCSTDSALSVRGNVGQWISIATSNLRSLTWHNANIYNLRFPLVKQMGRVKYFGIRSAPNPTSLDGTARTNMLNTNLPLYLEGHQFSRMSITASPCCCNTSGQLFALVLQAFAPVLGNTLLATALICFMHFIGGMDFATPSKCVNIGK